MKLLTNRQQRVLDFVVSYTRDNGRPPTLREIAASPVYTHRVSTNSVACTLRELERKGRIVRDRTNGATARNIRVLADGAAQIQDQTLYTAPPRPIEDLAKELYVVGRSELGLPSNGFETYADVKKQALAIARRARELGAR